jgi:hypothetical protein
MKDDNITNHNNKNHSSDKPQTYLNTNTMTAAEGNPCPGMGQAHICGRNKSV